MFYLLLANVFEKSLHVLHVSFPQHFLVSRIFSSCYGEPSACDIQCSSPTTKFPSLHCPPDSSHGVWQVTHSACQELTNAWLPGAPTAVPFSLQTPGGCSGALPTMSRWCMCFPVSRSNILQTKSLPQGGHDFMSTHILRAVQPCATSPLWRA